MTLYQLVRPLARIAFKTYFSNIFLINAENLPADKPVILAVNHPTAFLEPCTLATILPRPLFYLARGDFFEKPIFNFLLRSLHILPIFRFRDGFSSLKKNSETFDACYEALAERKLIMILVEGSTEEVFRLRPLQKGAARIAFGAIEKTPGLDVHIVPLGVSFTNPNKFRSQANFSIGKPIRISEYWEDYLENPQKAVREVTVDLQNELQDRLIHIEKKEDEALTKGLMELYLHGENRLNLSVLSTDSAPLAAQMEIARNINQMEDTAKKEWEDQLKTYRKLLLLHKQSDLGVARRDAYNLANSFLLLIGLLFFIPGLFANFIPAFLAHKLTLNKVYQREYFSGVRIALAIGFYLFYYLILLISGWLTIGWIVIPTLLVMMMLMYPTILYYDLFNRWWAGMKFFRLKHEIRRDFIKKREDLLI